MNNGNIKEILQFCGIKSLQKKPIFENNVNLQIFKTFNQLITWCKMIWLTWYLVFVCGSVTDIDLSGCPARQLAAKIAENRDTADPEHRMDSALSSRAIVTSHGKVLLVLLSTRSPHVGEFFTGKLDTNVEIVTENTTTTIWLKVLMVEDIVVGQDEIRINADWICCS